MSIHTPLDPNRFPFTFHQVLQSPDGLYEIGRGLTEQQAKHLARRFRRFRMSLRAFASHPLVRVEATKSLRTRIVAEDSIEPLFRVFVRVASGKELADMLPHWSDEDFGE